MSKQFEELRQPVAYWNKSCDFDDGAFSYANDAGCDSPLYSQECVTALLTTLEEKDRIIAVHEHESTSNHMRNVEEVMIRHRFTELQEDIKAVVNLLESREWAEHCTKTELGKRLESEITRLHNEKSENNDN